MPEVLATLARTADPAANAPSPVALNIVMTMLLFGCLACWLVAAGRMRQGLPLVARERRLSVPWNLIDVACVIFLLLVAIVTGAAVFGVVTGLSLGSTDEPANLSAKQQIAMMFCMECGMLVAVLLAVGHLMYRAGATLADMGLLTMNLGRDVAIGVLAFLMLTAPVLAIQAGLGALFPNANQHPFIELLREQADSATISMIFVVAVLLAPPIEEFLFRVVMQGWLQRFILFNIEDLDVVTDVVNDAEPDAATVPTEDVVGDASSDRSQTPALRQFNPFTSRIVFREPQAPTMVQAWFPIVVASLLFSLAHSGQGTAPIPLFFLSLGLGFIYQRTHRIWPSVVTHMLVNGLAVLQLKIALDSGMQL